MASNYSLLGMMNQIKPAEYDTQRFLREEERLNKMKAQYDADKDKDMLAQGMYYEAMGSVDENLMQLHTTGYNAMQNRVKEEKEKIIKEASKYRGWNDFLSKGGTAMLANYKSNVLRSQEFAKHFETKQNITKIQQLASQGMGHLIPERIVQQLSAYEKGEGNYVAFEMLEEIDLMSDSYGSQQEVPVEQIVARNFAALRKNMLVEFGANFFQNDTEEQVYNKVWNYANAKYKDMYGTNAQITAAIIKNEGKKTEPNQAQIDAQKERENKINQTKEKAEKLKAISNSPLAKIAFGLLESMGENGKITSYQEFSHKLEDLGMHGFFTNANDRSTAVPMIKAGSAYMITEAIPISATLNEKVGSEVAAAYYGVDKSSLKSRGEGGGVSSIQNIEMIVDYNGIPYDSDYLNIDKDKNKRLASSLPEKLYYNETRVGLALRLKDSGDPDASKSNYHLLMEFNDPEKENEYIKGMFNQQAKTFLSQISPEKIDELKLNFQSIWDSNKEAIYKSFPEEYTQEQKDEAFQNFQKEMDRQWDSWMKLVEEGKEISWDDLSKKRKEDIRKRREAVVEDEDNAVKNGDAGLFSFFFKQVWRASADGIAGLLKDGAPLDKHMDDVEAYVMSMIYEDARPEIMPFAVLDDNNGHVFYQLMPLSEDEIEVLSDKAANEFGLSTLESDQYFTLQNQRIQNRRAFEKSKGQSIAKYSIQNMHGNSKTKDDPTKTVLEKHQEFFRNSQIPNDLKADNTANNIADANFNQRYLANANLPEEKRSTISSNSPYHHANRRFVYTFGHAVNGFFDYVVNAKYEDDYIYSGIARETIKMYKDLEGEEGYEEMMETFEKDFGEIVKDLQNTEEGQALLNSWNSNILKGIEENNMHYFEKGYSDLIAYIANNRIKVTFESISQSVIENQFEKNKDAWLESYRQAMGMPDAEIEEEALKKWVKNSFLTSLFMDEDYLLKSNDIQNIYKNINAQ